MENHGKEEKEHYSSITPNGWWTLDPILGERYKCWIFVLETCFK